MYDYSFCLRSLRYGWFCGRDRTHQPIYTPARNAYTTNIVSTNFVTAWQKGNQMIAFAFFRFGLRLLLILTAALVVGRAVGAARTPSLLEQASSNPDGTPCAQPCLFGIHPGETSGEEVMRLLETHPLTYNAERTTDEILWLKDSEYYVFYHVTPRGVVESIGMTATLETLGYTLKVGPYPPATKASMEAVRLGDYVLTFGVTEVLLLERRYLLFPDSEVGTLAVTIQPDDLNEPIKPDTPITALIVSMIPPCGMQDLEVGGAWRGFISLTHYANQHELPNFTPSRFPMPDIRVCRA